MQDRENVIKGLEVIRKFFSFGLPSKEPAFEAYQNILTDTIVLLKEQEEEIENLKQTAQSMIEGICLLKEQEMKTGHWVSVDDGDVVAIDNDGFPERTCYCSECKKYLIASDEYAVYGRYCPFCGAKMEGR